MGGTETYVRELVDCLSRCDEVDLRLLVRHDDELATTGLGITVRSVPGAGVLPRLSTLASTAASRHARLATRAAHVVHYPLTVPVPRPARSAQVVTTLHDVQHLDIPEMFSAAELAYRRMMYDVPARRAATVITISEFSKARIVAQLGIPPDRIMVAPLGCQPRLPLSHTAMRENFVLYPARRWPHKNHNRLFEAVAILRATRPGLRLVLTGDSGGRRPGDPEWAESRGLVPREVLLDLYRRAGCLAFPSRYEGFGLPPLEAMAVGCPVAVARAASLPEVCGDAASYFDPDNPHEMAAAIDDALSGGTARAAAGVDAASRYTWQRCARAHIQAYRHAIATGPA
jgi:glycosyltransferase involved in cell wall biosynthesis